MVDKVAVALGQVFLLVLRFFPVSIIAPEFRTHLFLYNRRYIIIIIIIIFFFFFFFSSSSSSSSSSRCTPIRLPDLCRLTASTSLFTFDLPFDAQALTVSLNKPQMNKG